MLDSEPSPLTAPLFSPALNSPFLSLGTQITQKACSFVISAVWSSSSERHCQSFFLGLFWEAAKGGNERPRGQARAPMTRGQDDSFPPNVKVSIENRFWWLLADLSTMVQWSVLEMACEVSGIKKASKSVSTSSQMMLKLCSLAISDEWNVLAVKHHLSSSTGSCKSDGVWTVKCFIVIHGLVSFAGMTISERWRKLAIPRTMVKENKYKEGELNLPQQSGLLSDWLPSSLSLCFQTTPLTIGEATVGEKMWFSPECICLIVLADNNQWMDDKAFKIPLYES
ncbi:hypothetical protein V6N11_010672 [Hibiscus sabdariffa]|uniref:Uncharacterized protein n=1 Tax=Hibiscus sabdariffa TaxID=183260 RepID=A0ABR2S5Z5_9ROSI